MRTYTTDILTGLQCNNFIEWFDNEIGTETDIDENIDENNNKTFVVTCFELEPNEVSKCRYFENNKL